METVFSVHMSIVLTFYASTFPSVDPFMIRLCVFVSLFFSLSLSIFLSLSLSLYNVRHPYENLFAFDTFRLVFMFMSLYIMIARLTLSLAVRIRHTAQAAA